MASTFVHIPTDTVLCVQSGPWDIRNITGTVSLPTGASTSALQLLGNASLASIDSKLNTLGQKLMAGSVPVTIASDQTPLSVTQSGAWTTGRTWTLNQSTDSVLAGVTLGDQYMPTIPDTGTSITQLLTDPDRNLKVRGNVLTDEGQFRDDFLGVALDPDLWTSSTTGNSSIGVANSFVTIDSGSNTGNVAYITAEGDYGPISIRTQFSMSSRQANKNFIVGFADDPTAPTIAAYFRFHGTDNTVVDCVTQSAANAANTQTTANVKIPNGTSATSNDYYVEVQPDQVTFIINGVAVAQHKLHIPGPYDVLNVVAKMTATGPGTAVSVPIDYIYLINQDSLQINNSFDGDPIPVRVRTGIVQTYSSAIVGLNVANNPTDIFTITGSASKTVRIHNVTVTATQTTSTIRDVQLIKRSSANSGGSSSTPAAVPLDSSNAAATAVVRAYTTNPTVGTLVGTAVAAKMLIGTTTTAFRDAFSYNTPNNSNAQEIVLRGVTEVLAINLNGVTSAGNLFDISITWSEE
jgi:hypothetical protein